MKKLKLRNSLLIIFSLLFVVCMSLAFMPVSKKAEAAAFANEASAFNDIAHAGGTYTIAETDGVNVKFNSTDTNFVYNKDIDITAFNGTQKFINFYVNMLGDRFVKIYVDIIDSADSSNYISVKINSKWQGTTHDSSIMAAVPSIGQQYAAFVFNSSTVVRKNTEEGTRKYSNITVSNSTDGYTTPYAPIHFSYDNATKKLYLTTVNNSYTGTKYTITDLDDTSLCYDTAWGGFTSDTVKVRIRVEGAVSAENPVELYITEIGGVKPVFNIKNCTVGEYYKMQLIKGASIRYYEPQGLRFSGMVSEHDFDILSAKDDVQFGMVIIPTALLSGELTVNTAKVNNVSVDLDKIEFSQRFGGYVYNVALYGIPEDYYITGISARAYVKVGDKYFYSDYYVSYNSRSIAQVAKLVMESGDGVPSASQAFIESLAALAGWTGDDGLFVTSTASSYKVVIPDYDYNYSGSSRNYNKLGAQEFVYFMNESLGYTFQVISDRDLALYPNSKYISIGNTTLFRQSGISIDADELGTSGYIIKTVGKSIFICGGLEPGSLFGVYDFLNRTVGYEYFSADEISITNLDSIAFSTVSSLNVKEIPSFDSRYLSSSVYFGDADGFNRYRMVSAFIPSGMHNSMTLISKSEYGTSHPEFFAQDQYGNPVHQLNYTAAGLVNEVVGKLTAILADTYNGGNYNKEQKYLFFGQEDYNEWDESSASLALYNTYKTDAASLVKFINQVADGVQAWIDVNQPGREVVIATFAYMKTLKPPVQYNANGSMKRDGSGNPIPADDSVVLRDNVIIRFAALSEMNYFESIEDSANSTIQDYLDGWKALGRVMTYFYSVYFNNHYVNANNLDAFPETYQYAEEIGVESIYDQYLSSGKMSPCFNHYRAYLQANLMWDVNANVSELTNRFFNHYYRDAASIMKNYLDEVKAAYANYASYGYTGELNETVYVDSSLWSKSKLLEWLGDMEDALDAIAKYESTDSALYNKLVDRITYESLSIRYLLIQLYGSTVYGSGLHAEKVAVYKLFVQYNMQPSLTSTLNTLKSAWEITDGDLA